MRGGRRHQRGASLQQRGERFQEALVLGLRADRDAQRAVAAQRAAGAHEDAALGQPAQDVALDDVLAQVEPDEVRLRLGGLEAQRPQPVLRPMRSARLRSTRRVTSSWWFSASSAAACAAALQKNGWRTWSTAVRNASDPHSA